MQRQNHAPVMRELAANGDVKGDTTTLEDFSVIAKLKQQERRRGRNCQF